MHRLPFRPHRFSSWLPLLVVGLLVVTGCGQNQSNGSSDSEDGLPYTVGEAVSDTTVALIVSSDFGTDTLATDQYERQVSFAMQGIPPNQRSGDQMNEAHRQIVRQFAARHVIQGKARQSGTEVDSAQITQQLENIKSRYESLDAFEQELASNNVTVDSLRRFIASRLREQMIQQEMANSAEQPTSTEIEEYSAENRRVRAQHILLKVSENADEATADSVRNVAEALIDSAMGGVTFEDLARRHSEGPSASRGGDLGFFTRDQMVEPFADAAFALSDSGDVAAEPVRTRFGYHVIRLTNPGEPMDTSRARQQMMQERRRDAFDEELDKLLADATVRANPSIVTAGLYEEESASDAEGSASAE